MQITLTQLWKGPHESTTDFHSFKALGFSQDLHADCSQKFLSCKIRLPSIHHWKSAGSMPQLCEIPFTTCQGKFFNIVVRQFWFATILYHNMAQFTEDQKWTSSCVPHTINKIFYTDHSFNKLITLTLEILDTTVFSTLFPVLFVTTFHCLTNILLQWVLKWNVQVERQTYITFLLCTHFALCKECTKMHIRKQQLLTNKTHWMFYKNTNNTSCCI
jgi:hypothetical protein